MKHLTLVFLILSLFVASSCEKIIMNPDAETDNLSLYNEYAKICIEKFGMEDLKGIDLIALADSIKPFITNDLSDKELFQYMSVITLRMQEGHTSLRTTDYKLNTIYLYFLGYPQAQNLLLVQKYYYEKVANPDVQRIHDDNSYFEILYGFLPQDKEIGYIEIINFNLNVSDEELEKMMMYLKDAKGIIIDVRDNLGGYAELAYRLASYFTDREVFIGTNYIKNGPGKSDFAASTLTLKPSGSAYTYTKPVVILHDRVTYSSGSLFCIMMDALDQTTSVGQIFGGGTGEIMDGFLSNGWQYIISTSNLIDSQGRPTDNGLEADIPMVINPADTNTDAIIERAVLELQ